MNRSDVLGKAVLNESGMAERAEFHTRRRNPPQWLSRPFLCVQRVKVLAPRLSVILIKIFPICHVSGFSLNDGIQTNCPHNPAAPPTCSMAANLKPQTTPFPIFQNSPLRKLSRSANSCTQLNAKSRPELSTTTGGSLPPQLPPIVRLSWLS